MRRYLLRQVAFSCCLEKNKGKIGYFAGINKMRFKKQVVPGDTLTLKVTFTKERAGICFADVEASVDGKVAACGEIMCAVRVTDFQGIQL